MKKIEMILCGVLFFALSAQGATPRVTEILSRLSSGFRTLGNYSVAFSVQASDYTTTGEYHVGGESYYMQLGAAEVYCTGKVRYEIDNVKKEVVIDQVDATSHNLLNNPTRAFDLLGDEFTATLLREQDGRAEVRLMPRAANAAMGAMRVTVDTKTMRPESIVYDFDGQQVQILIRAINADKSGVKAFDKGAYNSYEFIDFR